MKKNSVGKDLDKTILKVLLVLVIIVLILVPFLYFAEVKKALSIFAFIVLPLLLGVIILLLSRTCTIDYKKKKKRILEKINN